MTANFYDDFAASFHLIFVDWQASMDRQGTWLDAFIRAEWPGAHNVLDAACGSGTQALPWDGPHYDLSLYLVEERASEPLQTRVFRDRYYAVPPAAILELMVRAGFERVRRVDGFVQPVLVGSRPAK